MRQLGKAMRDPFQKCCSLGFDAVVLVPEPPMEALLNRTAQPEGEIGLQACGGDLFKPLNQVPIQTTAIALLRQG